MSDHLNDDLALLVVLDESDPERREAQAHARACPECGVRWSEALLALGLLERVAPPPPPAPGVMRALEARITDDLPAPALATLGGAAVLALFGVVLVGTARFRTADPLDWLAAAAAFAIALGCAVRVSSPGRARAALVLASSVGLVALTARAPTDALAPMLGLKCVTIELVAAALPYAFTAYAARRFGLGVPSLAGATVAVAGALAGQAALHVTCRAHGSWPHETVFHLGAVVASVLLGAACAGPVSRWASTVPGRG